MFCFSDKPLVSLTLSFIIRFLVFIWICQALLVDGKSVSTNQTEQGKLPNCAVEFGTNKCLAASLRVDCHPEPNASREKCHARGCVWCMSEDGDPQGTPWCYTPPEYGYKMIGSEVRTELGMRVNLTRSSLGSSHFGNDFNLLTADFEFWGSDHLRIKIYPVGVDRYEVPLKLHISPASSVPATLLYSIEFSNDPVFSFRVKRSSTGTTIFDTATGGLAFSNQFIQFSTKLASTNVYGIGENEQRTFRHDFSKFQKFALWTRDQAPDGNTNMYGVQPHYTVIEPDGNAHAVMIVNSNAMEFVMMPAPGITYRTIGGLLDLHLFLGPTPENTVQQFTSAVGRAHIPPYWALGFQLCRWGYNNLETMQAAVNRTRHYQIPHDVQYGDIDIMERALDFTISEDNFRGLPDYVNELKKDGVKFVTILDPGISPHEPVGTYKPFDLANQLETERGENIWIRRPDGTPTVGKVWPGETYFPDFSSNVTREWWVTLIKEFSQKLAFDGLWIDMNEPASWGKGDISQGCVENSNQLTNYNNPPYMPGIKNALLQDMTICPDASQKFGVHYNTHSLYGWSQSEPTQTALRAALGKRSMVLTRSTYLGVGKWAAHWLGDNYSVWTNLHYSIIGMLSFNVFGVPFVGADICGFWMDSNEELCLRWQQLGAFYAFARNHNARNNKPQDPGYFGDSVANAARSALEIRYTMLPYLNTLFYLHSTRGTTVIRSLAFEFPTDKEALGIDKQFLWGSGFLISPVLSQGQTEVTAYFPNATWYHYGSGTKLSVRQGYTTLNAPLTEIPLHLRGGIVFPTQEHALNTEAAKKKPFGLIIALDENGEAKGELYLDDGDSIDPDKTGQYFRVRFVARNGSCKGHVMHDGFDVSSKVIDTVRLLGAGKIVEVIVGNSNHEHVRMLPSGEIRIEKMGMRFHNGFSFSWTSE